MDATNLEPWHIVLLLAQLPLTYGTRQPAIPWAKCLKLQRTPDVLSAIFHIICGGEHPDNHLTEHC